MIHRVIADWKDTNDLIAEFKKAIEKLGGRVYLDPTCEGTDAYGFIVSDKKLTRSEIKEITKFPEE